MPLRKDPSGKRSVAVEVEVQGSPEEVWRAIATGPGVSSWFVPTRIEHDAAGKPVRVIADFGPGMESVAKVTSWDPPRSFTADSGDLGPGAPTVATQWIVEARGGGKCVVRVVHSLFADTDDWDNQLDGWESGWPAFFRLLRLYLKHFRGQPCATIQCAGFAPEPKADAWAALLQGLGFPAAPQVGARLDGAPEAPRIAGTVEHAGPPEYPEELVLVLDAPTPGIAHLFAFPCGQVLVSVRLYLYGPTAADAAARQAPVWTAWIAQRFKAPDA